MWALYWKRFPISQGLVVALCATLRFVFGRSWLDVGIFFVMFEVAALVGAYSGWRLQEKYRELQKHFPKSE